MAITKRADAAAATGINSATPSYPAGVAAGDGIVLVVASKFPGAVPYLPGQEWSLLARSESGAGAPGTLTGAVSLSFLWREAPGALAGGVSVFVPGASVMTARIFAFAKTAAAWQLNWTIGADVSPGTGVNAIGNTDPRFLAGDAVFAGFASNSNAQTFAGIAVTATGASFLGGVSSTAPNATAPNLDLVTTFHNVSSGQSSTPPVFGATANGSTATSPTGPAIFLRLRETVEAGANRIWTPGQIASGTPIFLRAADAAYVRAYVGQTATSNDVVVTLCPACALPSLVSAAAGTGTTVATVDAALCAQCAALRTIDPQMFDWVRNLEYTRRYFFTSRGPS